MTPKTILDEAETLVSGDRRESYGHPLENFSDIAAMWTGYLHAAGKLSRLDFISADDVALMMVAVKLARLGKNTHHRDSLVDLVGYARTLEMAQDKRANQYLERGEKGGTLKTTG